MNVNLRSRFRAHPVLMTVGAGLVLAVLVLGAVWIYVLGDQRRTGRLVSRLLTRELGLPVEVDRAITRGTHHLTLRGVRLLPSPYWDGTLQIRDIQVDGGLVPFVFPEGRHLSVQVGFTSVILSDRTAPVALPTKEGVGQARRAILQLLQWPLSATVNLPKGELRSGKARVGFDLKGEKQSDGQAQIRLNVRHSEGNPSTMDLSGKVSGDAVVLTVQLDGSANLLRALWPSALPEPGRFTARAALRLPSTPLIEATGEFTAVRSGGSPPLTGRLAAGYHLERQRLDLSSLEISKAPDLTMEAHGSVEEIGSSPRLMINVKGRVGDSRIESAMRATANDRHVMAEFKVTPVALRPLFSALGWAQDNGNISMRAGHSQGTVNVSFSPDWGVERMHASVQLHTVTVEVKGPPGGEVKLPALSVETTTHGQKPDGQRLMQLVARAATVESRLMGFPATMGIAGQARVRLHGRTIDQIEGANIFFTTPGGESFGQLTAQPDSSGPHVLSLVLTLPSLEQLPRVLSWRGSLKGSAVVEGLVAWQGAAPRVQGVLRLELQRGEVDRPRISLSEASVRVPFRYGDGDEKGPEGTLEIGRLQSLGLMFDRIKCPIRFVDGKLSLPSIAYSHYGGEANGWLEAEVTSAGLKGQFRLDGRAVELSRLIDAYQLTGTRVTGKTSYLVVGRREASGEFEAGGRVTVGEPGGVISTDLLKRLLSYAEADPSGVLRTTLENLSEFPYKSLTAEARTVGREVRLSLSLLGKERFGIFPPKVKAINIQNLPLSFLLKAASTSTEQRR